MGIYGPKSPYGQGYYKAVSHHRLKRRAQDKAAKLRMENPDVSYRVTRAEDHAESKDEWGSGWIVWAAIKKTEEKEDRAGGLMSGASNIDFGLGNVGGEGLL